MSVIVLSFVQLTKSLCVMFTLPFKNGAESLPLASDTDLRLRNLPCKHLADTGK